MCLVVASGWQFLRGLSRQCSCVISNVSAGDYQSNQPFCKLLPSDWLTIGQPASVDVLFLIFLPYRYRARVNGIKLVLVFHGNKFKCYRYLKWWEKHS